MATAIVSTLARWLKCTTTTARMAIGLYNPLVITITLAALRQATLTIPGPGPRTGRETGGIVVGIDYLVLSAPSTFSLSCSGLHRYRNDQITNHSYRDSPTIPFPS